MEKTLITGGSGFIGTHFHQYLPHDQIVNLDLLSPVFGQKATFVQGDIRIKEDIRRAVKGHKIKSIISLAAKHHDFGIGHDEYFDTNEAGTEILCEVASENDINEIIFFSSVAVYGLQNHVSTEELSPSPDSPYGASKLAGEKVLQKWLLSDPGRKVLVIRPTVVFGPHNKANMFNLIRQIHRGQYFHLGKADNIKSIAYVENLVQATLYLRERLLPGFSVYNYADEPHLTAKEISTAIAGRLGKKIPLSVPLWLGLLFGKPFDMAIKVTGKNLPVSSSRIKKLATQTFHSAKKVFSTGFKPTYTTREGLIKMVDWYLSLRPSERTKG